MPHTGTGARDREQALTMDQEHPSPNPILKDTCDSALQLPDDWLRDFYKECGREVTLAYTTLNQMKNWAIVVQASIIAAVVSFGKSEVEAGVSHTPIVVGALLAYVLTMRFFVRAILCYLNLLRWNVLQAAIVEYKLVPKDPSTTSVALEAKLREKIANYYHRWLAVVPRSAQLSSNLKLGFGLLLTMPVLLFAWGASMSWQISAIRGMTVFAIGATLIETLEFFRSSFFDTPDVAAERTATQRTFPNPEGSDRYVWFWVAVLLTSLVVGLWPWLAVWFFGIGILPEPTR